MKQITAMKKRITVTAFQFNKKEAVAIVEDDFESHNIYRIEINNVTFFVGSDRREGGLHFSIKSTGGKFVNVSDEDWILIDYKGNPYPCDPEIFANTYDIIESD